MKHRPLSYPTIPDVPAHDEDAVLDQAEPDFTLDGRCLDCLRFLPASGLCVCQEKAS